MRSHRNWFFDEQDAIIVEKIIKEFNFKRPIANLIAKKGLKHTDEIEQFLNPTLSRLPSPTLLKDLKKGAERIAKAIINGEKIAVYGDYDADGVTACALVFLFLRAINANVTYYIPDRFEDGYSLNKRALDELKVGGVNLVVTVDCGISDYELVEYGNSIGLEFVITDHHNVPKKLPKACAVINPKRSDCSFPFKELAGVGVAFYLLIKLRKVLREAGYFSNLSEPNLKEYLDIVTIGTVSDMVPLLGPNRIFVKHGLEEMKKNKRAGIKALLSELNIDNLDTRLISFRITPRLNAPGRMSNPKHAFQLLVSNSDYEARELVKTLNIENQRRQKEEEKVIQSALKMIEGVDQFVYVLYDDKWHPGVLGIVASKLVEKFDRPFFIFTSDEEGVVRGSGRSVEGFPLTEVMEQLSDLFLDFGGHDMACGLTLKKEDINLFSAKINASAKDYLLNGDSCKVYKVDTLLEISDVDDRFFEELALLEPFGKGNMEPTFLVPEVTVEKLKQVGPKENHLKLLLKKGNYFFNSIGFFMFADTLKEQSKIDIVGLPKLNVYNGVKSWDFMLKDFCILE
ncbi:MAG: single-stranded-DNA-specific exonuclease RecJ [bacterium]